MGDILIKILFSVLLYLQNFSIQLICIELLFCWHLPKRRKWFPLGIFIAIFIAVYFSQEFSFLTPWREYMRFSRWPYFRIGDFFHYGYLFLFTLLALSMWLCFESSFYKIMMYCSLAYILQNMAKRINAYVEVVFFNDNAVDLGYRLVAQGVIIGTVLCAYFLVVRRYAINEHVRVNHKFTIVFLFLTLAIVNNLCYVAFSLNPENKENLFLNIYVVITCVLLIALQFSVFGKTKSDLDNTKMEELLRKKSWQQEFFKSNVDVINRKCHNLKHEIAALRLMGDREREESIGELERSVMIYDTITKTGNEMMDIILTEHRLTCDTDHIEFSCMVDGEALSFINQTDLYVMLGNALDNAIEAERKEEEANRIIYLGVERRKDMVAIRLENYFSGTLQYADGRIQSSKAEKGEHGFGLKSIRLIAEKYGGHVKIVTGENRFRLLILFSGKCIKKGSI